MFRPAIRKMLLYQPAGSIITWVYYSQYYTFTLNKELTMSEEIKAEKLYGAPPDEPEVAVKPPKKRIRNYVLSFLFLIVLIAVTFYVIFKDRSLIDVFNVLQEVRLPYIGAGVLSMLLSLIVQGVIIGMAANWIRLRLRFREMMQYSALGFFYSGVTPSSSGGQPMQFFYLVRDGIHYSKTTLILFVTNITYQLAVVVLGLSMVIVKWNYISSVDPNLFILFFFGFAINFFMLLLLLGVMFSEKILTKLLRGVVKLLAKIRIIKNREKALRELDKYVSEVKAGVSLIRESPKRFFSITGATMLQLILYHLVPYFVYKSFGFSEFSVFDFVAVSAVLYISVSFMPLPGSVGASESGYLLLMRPLFGISILPGMLLSRFINFYTMFIISGIISIYVHVRKPYGIGRTTNPGNKTE